VRLGLGGVKAIQLLQIHLVHSRANALGPVRLEHKEGRHKVSGELLEVKPESRAGPFQRQSCTVGYWMKSSSLLPWMLCVCVCVCVCYVCV
jgi:hypothetical protein